MNNLLFLCGLTAALIVAFAFAFRCLPRENWQFIAAVPVKKLPDGSWRAKNLTWYGFFIAVSLLASLLLFTVLVRSAGVAALPSSLFLAGLVLIAAPFAKILARLIEKRRGTLTIGGAVFVGLLFAPWAALGLDRLGFEGSLQAPLLAAMFASYALGEGIGRLACLSFGCCYGKKMTSFGSGLKRVFASIPVVFHGTTKKASYAGGLEGEKLFPIQAVTTVLFSAVAVVSSYLFLEGSHAAAYLLASLVTLLWRPLSEVFRADFRGGGTISAYQRMSLFGAGYSFIAFLLLPFPNSGGHDVLQGLKALADWRFVLFAETAFLGAFLFTGVSTVTAGTVRFSVNPAVLGKKTDPC